MPNGNGTNRLSEEDVQRIATKMLESQAASPIAEKNVKIIIVFQNSTDCTFNANFVAGGLNPSEAQFVIAGTELLAVGERLRAARLAQSLKMTQEPQS